MRCLQLLSVSSVVLVACFLGPPQKCFAQSSTKFNHFRRGDVNADGRLSIIDPIHLLLFLFAGEGSRVLCKDAADSDDNGKLNVSDAIYTLRYVFAAGSPPPPPFTECGGDPTRDPQSCVSFNICEHPPEEAWIARYDGSGRASCGGSPHALALDRVGNVYVAGEFCSTYATVKYQPDGKELWAVRLDGSLLGLGAAALAVDPAGNAYLTGETLGYPPGNLDYGTIKLDPDGNELWVARYDGPGETGDYASAIAVDGGGNVYVTGGSQSHWAETGYDYATIKYGPDGKELWVARFNGSGSGDDLASALALDPDGNIYVTGISELEVGGVRVTATLKYDPDGKLLWVAQHKGPRGLERTPVLALDRAANVYIAGSSLGGSFDYATVKYSTDGNELWSARYNGPGNGDDFVAALAVDRDGNAYVTGASTGSSSNFDYGTVKYDTSGKEVWVARYNGESNSRDDASALTVDDAGNVFVTGSSFTSGENFDYDYATVQYDSGGNQIRVVRFDGANNLNDGARAIAVDTSGNIYVTGTSGGHGMLEFATVKYVMPR